MQLEGQEVARAFDKDLLPMKARLHDVASRPCPQSVGVQALASRRGPKIGLDVVERLLDLRQDRLVLEHQQEITAEALGQHKIRVRFKRGLDLRGSCGPVIQIIGDGLIDMLGRICACGRELNPSAVDLHARSLHLEILPGSTPKPLSTRSGVAGNS
jgi:hypothetical protein